uniref:GDNF family receptor alpha 2 n=1 Tax=Athene cunicularia TaxID=194338 RepID=A0A663MFE7_ATHCN
KTPCLFICLFDEILRSLAGPPSPPGQDPHGWRVPVDCVRANELCAAEPSCSSRYRTLRQCLAGRDRNTMLANKECQAALEVLQESPLYDCRCKRGMKKELQCLQIYWSIHLGLTEGEEFYEASPYEPVTSRLSDIFRLASIFSGMDPATNSKSNHCLDAAKACNLNDNCKRLRSGYISTCSKEISATEHCSRRKCHKALRQFFDRVPSEYTYRLLFCSCKDQACAERRRQTIVPSCSYEDKEKPNCLDLRNTCRTDHLCRARLGGHAWLGSAFFLRDPPPSLWVASSQRRVALAGWASSGSSGTLCAKWGRFIGFWLLVERLRCGLEFGLSSLWGQPVGLCRALCGLPMWGLPTEPPAH